MAVQRRLCAYYNGDMWSHILSAKTALEDQVTYLKSFSCILHGKRALILSENEIPAPNLSSYQPLSLSLSEKQNAELGKNHFLYSNETVF